MTVTTRSRGILNLLKASKSGVAKRTKASALKASALKASASRASISKVIVNDEGLANAPAASCRASPAAAGAPLVSSVASVLALPHNSTPGSTTSDMLKEGILHLLKVEPKLAQLIEEHECTLFSEEGLAEIVDPFHSLASGIISQQVSSAAARSIKAKFVNLFSEDLAKEGISFPTPDMILKCDQTTLRGAGLSGRKAEYVHSLAEHFQSGDLSTEVLENASNEDVVKRLVQVRGLGGEILKPMVLGGTLSLSDASRNLSLVRRNVSFVWTETHGRLFSR